MLMYDAAHSRFIDILVVVRLESSCSGDKAVTLSAGGRDGRSVRQRGGEVRCRPLQSWKGDSSCVLLPALLLLAMK